MKAHHIPALKMVSTTPQPGKNVMAKARRKYNGAFFIIFFSIANVISCHFKTSGTMF